MLVETCQKCGLQSRYGEWMLDTDGRAVTGIVWVDPDGTAVRVRPFAWNKNRRPSSTQLVESIANTYPHASIGGTPPCPSP